MDARLEVARQLSNTTWNRAQGRDHAAEGVAKSRKLDDRPNRVHHRGRGRPYRLEIHRRTFPLPGGRVTRGDRRSGHGVSVFGVTAHFALRFRGCRLGRRVGAFQRASALCVRGLCHVHPIRFELLGRHLCLAGAAGQDRLDRLGKDGGGRPRQVIEKAPLDGDRVFRAVAGPAGAALKVERTPLRLQEAGDRGIARRPLQVKERADVGAAGEGEVERPNGRRSGAGLLGRFPDGLRLGNRHRHGHQRSSRGRAESTSLMRAPSGRRVNGPRRR